MRKASEVRTRRSPVDTQTLRYQREVSQGPRLDPLSTPGPYAREDLVRSFENFLENPNGVDVGRGGAIVHATDNNALSSVLNTASGNIDDRRRNYHLYAAPSPSTGSLGRYGDSLEQLDPITRDFLLAKRILDLPEAHPSVMFVASHFADDIVATSQWATRTEMAASFYEKARLVADFKLEKDQITLIQSFVLLGERWESPILDEPNQRSCDNKASSKLSKSKALLWKRIIWVVLAWGRYTALAVGAPTLIDNRRTDADSASLEEYYFDESPEDPAADRYTLRSLETA
ncbi:uncharacterized protein K452DRAFT_360685 [Aplosporella prunicola CBS 121167]|uniref:Transcription factor domain-containing protein n=1 Tax=Aplosporella prunicola CBS 121167 TaxID=1176127 RepID=A0A6A6B4X4_9PEZI|nr:uncharacterized protein K452DRAFT_360685 [Aplosporella prunicola CBS 121167]KAF2138916.1 hypothetical protein K452DRAFT_360685 [Aplosporella prunicola CBS 121167]